MQFGNMRTKFDHPILPSRMTIWIDANYTRNRDWINETLSI